MGLKELHIPNGKTTPLVNFSSKTGTLSITGRSLPQDAYGFYEPLITWLRKFVQSPTSNVELNIDLEYLDSTSSKQIFNILRLIGNLQSDGVPTKVCWIHEQSDELMLYRGKEMARLSNIDMEFCAKEDEEADDEFYIPE